MPGLAVNVEILNDPSVQMLPPAEFRRAFYAALGGEKNVFSRFLRRWSDRPSADEWRDLRSYVFERDDYICTYCGASGGKLECDHIVPISRGGSNFVDNLTTSCKSCNRAKGSKLLSEWQP